MFSENHQFDFGDSQEIQFTLPELSGHSLKVHENAIHCAANFLTAEAELLDAIIQIDLDKTYLKFRMTHLTPYCVKYLKLSPDVAENFVRVARKSHQVPEIREAVDQGLSVSKLKPIISVLNADNQRDWIEKAQTLSRHKLEKEVAKANPSLKKPDRAKPTGADRTRLEFEMSDAQMTLQKRATDLVSRKLGRSASLAEVQQALLENFIDRHDPVKKAERAVARKRTLIEKPPKSHPPRGGSRPTISAKVRHEVNLRDKGCCQAKNPDGSLCLQTRWVDFHHLVLRSRGGQDVAENLVTLCSAHHRMWHQAE